MRIGAGIQTDDRKIEAIVRTKYLTIALRGRSNSQASRTHCKSVEELTSRNHSSLLQKMQID
jgi:hypothetical protein